MDNSIVCDLFSRCSGCKSLRGVRVPEVWDEICEFFKGVAPIQVELISKEIRHWRSRAKLAVRGSLDLPQIGLFAEGSHEVVDMKSCSLHYPVMDDALEKIRKGIIEYKIKPYQEKGHLGRFRYVQMVVDRKSLKIQLSLVFKGSSLEENEKAFVKRLYKERVFHSIWANYLPEKTNAIFGRSWELLEGEDVFFQEIGKIAFAFHPSCFAQAHLSLFEEMISYIDSLIAKDLSILELYAGVGCIGLSLADKAKKVLLVESSPYAKNSFEKSLNGLSLELKEKCLFLSSKVEDVDVLEGDVILVDPPRKGLSRECKEKIFASDAKQIIYISCGYESFMRDCLEILAKGWMLTDSRGFLLFPGTNHVEIVASFSKT